VLLWRRIYGRLCTELKKTPDEVGTMTLAQAHELFEFWRECPPGGFAGVGYGPAPEAPKRATRALVEGFVAQVKGSALGSR
jgi:hypothetical protein